MTEATTPPAVTGVGTASNGQPDGQPGAFGAMGNLQQALASVNDELTKGDGPLDFTENGAAELVRANTRYTTDLALQAIRIARDERVDAVSRTHVEQASRAMLRQAGDNRRTTALTLGSLFAGAGGQEFLGILFSDAAASKLQLSVTVGIMLMGAVAMALSLRRQK